MDDTFSTLSVRRRRRRKLVLSTFPRVPPRSARVSPAVTHGAPPPEAALCGCESRGGRVERGESIRKTIYDIRRRS